jgi:hypothetical protein
VADSGIDFSRPAVRFAGSTGSVHDTKVNAFMFGFGVTADVAGHFDIARSSISGGQAVSATNGANLDVDDSVVTGPAGFTGLSAYGSTKSSTLTATNVTVAGTDPTAGTGVHAKAYVAGKSAVVTLQNSIVYGVKTSLEREASAGLAYVKADHSAYDPAAVSESGIGNTWDAGGNTSAAPGFVDPAAHDYRLAPGSALIDAGGDGFPVAAKDLAGADRSLDGNGDGSAVPDIGAFEFVPPAPVPPAPTPDPVPSPTPDPVPTPDPGPGTPPPPAGEAAPKLTHVSLSRRRFLAARGSKLRYTLSKNAIVTVRVKRVRSHRRLRAAGSLSFPAAAGEHLRRFRRRALAPGRYVALVVARDASGHRSAERRVSFRILPHA